MASGGGTKKKDPKGNPRRQDEEDDDEDEGGVTEDNNDFRDNTQDGDDSATLRPPKTWQEAFLLQGQQMQQVQQQMAMEVQFQMQQFLQQFQAQQLQPQQLPAQAQVQPQQGGGQPQQGPAQQPAQQPVVPPPNVPVNVNVPPPGIPPPNVTPFDHVCQALWRNAVDQDGTNPVVLAIDREVKDRAAIHAADNNAKAQDYKYALSGYDNLDPIQVYDMTSGPREFDTWKDAWRDQVFKLARGVHPSSIKTKCLLEMKKSVSTNTWHWIQSCQDLDRNRDDPDAILVALQRHAHDTANVAAMLHKAAQNRAGPESNHVEVDAGIASVVRYFDKTCRGNSNDGIHKWLLLLNYGDIPKLRIKLIEKFEKVNHHEMFRFIENYFETSKKSANLFTSGEAYNVSVNQKSNWIKGQGQQGKQERGRPREKQPQQNRARSQSAGPQSRNGNRCGYCGGQPHDRAQCPAREKSCGKCSKPGHFASVCRSNPTASANKVESKAKPKQSNQAQANSVEVKPAPGTPQVKLFGSNLDLNSIEIDLANVERLHLDDLGIQKLDRVDCILTDRKGNSAQVRGLPDTGANINLLPDWIARNFSTYREVMFPDVDTPSTDLKIIGIVQTDVLVDDQLIPDVIWCTAKTEKVLLSKKTCQLANWIPQCFPRVKCNAVSTKQPFEGFDVLPDHSEKKKSLTISFPKAKNLENIAQKFPEVFGGHIGRVKGPPAHIELRADAVPTASGAHRRVAEAYMQPLRSEIEEQVEAGILEKVDETPETNYWLHPIVVVPKKGTDKIRLCVDFRRLNEYCIRPSNPEGTPWEKIRNLPTGKRWYAVFDANKGYHQVPLDEPSRKLTTFFTPHGKYRYLSLPMGYAGSQDIFTQRFGSAVDAFIEARATEDCLIAADSEDELIRKTERFFEACRTSGITLNTKKTQSGHSVIFAGYQIDEGGAKLDPALYKAIADFPVPRTLTELRSFLGLAQQQAHFTSAISELTSPLHPLLKKSNDWIWTQEMNQAFIKTKQFLSTPAALAFYDHRRETRLYTDASRLNGLGFVLKQKQPDGYWRTVQAGSRYLTSAEERYAMVELELLAIAWACKKTAAFTEGINFMIVTDHKPLIPILRDYSLAEIENKRLQRLRMKIDHLTYQVEWIKGADNKEADALSRAPSSRPTAEDEIDEPHDFETNFIAAQLVVDPALEVNAVFSEKYDQMIDESICTTEPMSDPVIKQILEVGNEDPTYTKVREWIKSGFPARNEVEVSFDPFIREQENFRLDGDVILYQSPESPASPPRLFVPVQLRKRFIDLLKLLHSHPNKMVARARRSLWWPFMNAELQREHRACKTCVEKSPSNPADNLLVHEPATYPFQVIHVDFGEYAGSQWLFGADQFSGWPIAKRLGTNARTEHLLKALTQEFSKFGIPEKILSDGGPQFKSQDFLRFCQRNGINTDKSSPYNPKSNGIAEQTVKEMKKLVHCLTKSGKIDEEEWTKAMLVYVNTPRRPLNRSPSELMFGRDVRDGISVLEDLLTPEHRQAIERRVQAIKEHQLSLEKADRLPELTHGQRVAVQDNNTKKWSKFGNVVGKPRKRSYHVKLDSGAVVWRNRRFLKPMPMRIPTDSPRPPPMVPPPPTMPTTATSPGDPPTDGAQPPCRRSSRTRRKPVRFQDSSP